MGQPVVHWEVSGKDSKKLQSFYSKLFDWKIEVTTDPAMGGYAVVHTGGEGGIGGGIVQTQPNEPTMVTFYVQVDDLQASLKKAERLGGKTVMPPMPIPNIGSAAMFSDPEGNVIGLFKGQM